MRIAITGADGTGKSTLIEQLMCQADFSCLRFPLQLKTTDVLYEINRTILQFAIEADRKQSIGLKAISLFAAMRLTGHYIAELSPSHEHIVTERDCFIDSLVYGHLYSSELSSKRPTSIDIKSISKQELEQFISWMQESPNFAGVETLDQILTKLLALFADPQLIQKLEEEYRCGFADHLVYLSAPVSLLMERITVRAAHLNLSREHHETQEQLTRLQQSYDFVLASLEQKGFLITRLDAQSMVADQIIDILSPDKPQTLRVESHAVHR